jgi:DNA-binding response OmpR family regulator
MKDERLDGRRVLIVEDEYFIADDLSSALIEAGANVLGPIPDVSEANALLAADSNIDAAILDINLHGEMAFSVADALQTRGIPFMFSTGYDEWTLPDRFSGVPRVEKPVRAQKLIAALRPLLREAAH